MGINKKYFICIERCPILGSLHPGPGTNHLLALQRASCRSSGKADAAAPTMHRQPGTGPQDGCGQPPEQTKEPAGGRGLQAEDAAGRAFALSISDASLPLTHPQWQCPQIQQPL